jgi:[pyruvate, water dikinase]-phosphate phosphotransferase / [pyruvate, water dikinase] kinase
MDSVRFGKEVRPGIPGRSATLLVVSDGGGTTAEAAVEAAMAQFPDVSFTILRRPGVRSREQVLRVVHEAAISRGIVVHTIVIQEIRRLLVSECRLRLLPHFDLIGPLIGHITQEVGQPPILRPGVARAIDVDYFQRIDAIQFTVQHDDGQNTGGLDEADIVLVGVSRCSKTPLSIYLSMRGWKVANIPIVLGIEPPAKLDEIDQTKVVALWIDLEHLIEIRRNRLESLDQVSDGDYANPEQVRAELDYCRKIVRRGYPWPMVNITGKSIEESAKEVVAVVERQRKIRDGIESPLEPGRPVLPPEEFRPS